VSTFPQADTSRSCRYPPKIGVFSYYPVLSVIFCAVGEEESGQMAATGSARLTDRAGMCVLTRLLPRDLIAGILTETGRREKRSRLFCPLLSWYFVMAMAVFRTAMRR
jgi:hypothetical protein